MVPVERLAVVHKGSTRAAGYRTWDWWGDQLFIDYFIFIVLGKLTAINPHHLGLDIFVALSA